MFVLPFPFRSCGAAVPSVKGVERIGMEWVFNSSLFNCVGFSDTGFSVVGLSDFRLNFG